MTIPTSSELNPHDDLDGRVAQAHFLGKTVSEAIDLFANQGGTVEDLMWMGPRAFVYYLPAALMYLERASADTDEWDVVGALPGTLGFRLDHDAAAIADALPEMERLCSFVLTQAVRLIDESDRVEVTESYRTLRDRIRKRISTGDRRP